MCFRWCVLECPLTLFFLFTDACPIWPEFGFSLLEAPPPIFAFVLLCFLLANRIVLLAVQPFFAFHFNCHWLMRSVPNDAQVTQMKDVVERTFSGSLRSALPSTNVQSNVCRNGHTAANLFNRVLKRTLNQFSLIGVISWWANVQC